MTAYRSEPTCNTYLTTNFRLGKLVQGCSKFGNKLQGQGPHYTSVMVPLPLLSDCRRAEIITARYAVLWLVRGERHVERLDRKSVV